MSVEIAQIIRDPRKSDAVPAANTERANQSVHPRVPLESSFAPPLVRVPKEFARRGSQLDHCKSAATPNDGLIARHL